MSQDQDNNSGTPPLKMGLRISNNDLVMIGAKLHEKSIFKIEIIHVG